MRLEKWHLSALRSGFEGSLDALLGGQVKVIDASTLPVPAGTHAIRFAPSGWSTGDFSCDDRFTARLAVAPAAKVIKLSVLSYGGGSSTSGPFQGWLRLAVPNGAVTEIGRHWTPLNGTPLPSPWSGALPGAGNTYGELKQIELALPAGTGSEVIFDLYRPCSEPLQYGDGLIIDDLRVE